MKLGRAFATLVLLLGGTGAAATETPTSAPAATPTPNLASLRLLDDLPNYAEVLVDQWRSGVAATTRAAAEDWSAYGRLLDIGPTQRLTLSDCITLAVKHNTALEVERLTPLAARAGIRQAEAQFDPVLSSEVTDSRAVQPASNVFFSGKTEQQNFDVNLGLRKVLLSGGQLDLSWTNDRSRSNSSIEALDPRYTTNLVFSLSQPLLRDFGLRFATILVRVAETAELQSIRNYEAQVAGIVAQVEAAYWRLVQATENVAVAERGLALAKELQRQNEDKYHVGALPQTAVLEAQAEVARRQSVLIRARKAETTTHDGLRALINFRPEGEEALLLIDPAEAPSVEPYPVDLGRSLKLALENRPELKAAQLDIHAKGLSLKASSNQLLPRLDFVGSIGVNALAGTRVPTPQPDPENPASGFAPQPSSFAGDYGDLLNSLPDGRFYSFSAGVMLEIPISNAQARADYSSAKIDLERSRLAFQQLQQGVTLEVKTAVSNLHADLQGIEATRVARELAERNLENQKARYDVGLATTKDLLDFQDRLTRARASEINALTTYNIDLSALRRAEGTLLRARNVVLDVMPKNVTPWWARF